MVTTTGPKAPGDMIDVSDWSPRAVEVSLSVGELVPAAARGRSRYVAAQRLRLADGWVDAGDEIPDSTWHSARGASCYLSLGQIRPNPLAAVPLTAPTAPL